MYLSTGPKAQRAAAAVSVAAMEAMIMLRGRTNRARTTETTRPPMKPPLYEESITTASEGERERGPHRPYV